MLAGSIEVEFNSGTKAASARPLQTQQRAFGHRLGSTRGAEGGYSQFLSCQKIPVSA